MEDTRKNYNYEDETIRITTESLNDYFKDAFNKGRTEIFDWLNDEKESEKLREELLGYEIQTQSELWHWDADALACLNGNEKEVEWVEEYYTSDLLEDPKVVDALIRERYICDNFDLIFDEVRNIWRHEYPTHIATPEDPEPEK